MNDIKVGDLVMVVNPRPCCGVADRMGIVFTVTRLEEVSSLGVACPKCKNPIKDNVLAINDNANPPFGRELSRLKKIPPLSEPTEIKQAVEA